MTTVESCHTGSGWQLPVGLCSVTTKTAASADKGLSSHGLALPWQPHTRHKHLCRLEGRLECSIPEQRIPRLGVPCCCCCYSAAGRCTLPLLICSSPLLMHHDGLWRTYTIPLPFFSAHFSPLPFMFGWRVLLNRGKNCPWKGCCYWGNNHTSWQMSAHSTLWPRSAADRHGHQGSVRLWSTLGEDKQAPSACLAGLQQQYYTLFYVVHLWCHAFWV